MANIHGFDHLEINPNYQELNEQNNNYNDELFLGYRDFINYGFKKHPSQENFLNMLKNSFCPRMKFKSFTTVLCFVLIILYILMIGIGGVDRQSRVFLSVYQQTLRQFGGNTPTDVKYSFEIFQWFTSTLLIPEFSGLIVALFLILTCYSTLEANYGYKFAISLYFLAGVSGALFGDVCNMCQPTQVTYSEVYPCLYGCTGFQIGILIKYWKQLGLSDRRWNFIFFTAIIFIMIMSATIWPIIDDEEDRNLWFYDYLGYLGGLLAGIFICLIAIDARERSYTQIMQQNGQQYENLCKLIGKIMFALQLGLSIILLYSIQC